MKRFLFALVMCLPFGHLTAQPADPVIEPGAQPESINDFIKANESRLFDDPLSPRLGPDKARLTLVNFTDYNCAYCKIFDPVLERVVRRHPEVAVVIKPLPFRAPSSLSSAQLALTVWRQDRAQFWTLHHLLMEKKGYLDEQSLEQARTRAQIAISEGDDVSRILIADNLRLAEGLGVMGTPATLIGDMLVPGAIPEAQLEEVVTLMLKRSTP